MLEIVNNQSEEILNKEEYVKDLNILKQRIENLSFFDECRSIEGFPKDDMVYVFNPIGLVNEFFGGCVISKDLIKLIDINVKDNNLNTHFDGINNACEKFRMNTCLEKAHFIVQVLHESAHLSTTKEYGVTETSYDGYYGRGLLQLTTKTNYEKYSDYIGEDCHSTKSNRNKLLIGPYSGGSAGWF